ncbi:hypothetical protein F5Y06DRAFT_289712 [Hypoxylon sp. FL0890]|nr:hypothetical protein F5Y06DRAFT_289712 [Hypoxylon sp. FL0890]
MRNENINGNNVPPTGSESTWNEQVPKLIEKETEPSIASYDSANGPLTPAVTETESFQGLEVPPWFLNDCVGILEELAAVDMFLEIHSSSIGPDAKESGLYAIRDVIYESLFDLISPPGESGGHQGRPQMTRPLKFAHDAMALQMPYPGHGKRFLEIVVIYFAKDIGADILRLSLYDFENLTAHFATLSGHVFPNGITDFSNLYFFESEKSPKEATSDDGKQETSASVDGKSKPIEKESDRSQGPDRMKKLPFPFERLFASVAEKKKSLEVNTQGQGDRPLIILLHDIADDFYGTRRSILTHLCDAVKDERARGREIAVIALDNRNDSVHGHHWALPSADHDFLFDLGYNPVKTVQLIVPVNNEAQRKLLEDDHVKSIRKKNIQKLQRKIREGLTTPSFSGLLEPYVDWEFSEESFAAKRLSDLDFNGCELELVASALRRDISGKSVERGFERLRILNEWMVGNEDEKKTPKAVKENTLLDSIVTPGQSSSSLLALYT